MHAGKHKLINTSLPLPPARLLLLLLLVVNQDDHDAHKDVDNVREQQHCNGGGKGKRRLAVGVWSLDFFFAFLYQ